MLIDVYKIILKVKVFCHRFSPLTTRPTTDDLDDASQLIRGLELRNVSSRSRLGRTKVSSRSCLGLVSAVKANVSVSSRSRGLTSRSRLGLGS